LADDVVGCGELSPAGDPVRADVPADLADRPAVPACEAAPPESDCEVPDESDEGDSA
jgi:hypothetical protein